MHAPPALMSNDVYFLELQLQPFPQPQRFSQVQGVAQPQVSAGVQPQDFFSQRQSFRVGMG